MYKTSVHYSKRHIQNIHNEADIFLWTHDSETCFPITKSLHQSGDRDKAVYIEIEEKI